MFMVMFIDPIIREDGKIQLNVFGEKNGTVVDCNIEEACYRLTRYLGKSDIAYIIDRNIGRTVIKNLERYISVKRMEPDPKYNFSDINDKQKERLFWWWKYGGF